MRSEKTRPAGIALMALGFLAAFVLLAGPASADDTNASKGSVTSGEAVADDGSTASGAAEATGGSTASGCSTADDGSTASGGECDNGDHNGNGNDNGNGNGDHKAAEVAKPTASKKLALTGSSTLPLAAGAVGFVLVGGLMTVAASDRRRAKQHS